MLVLSRFFARATSLSVTLVHRDILTRNKKNYHPTQVHERWSCQEAATEVFSPFHLSEVHHVADGAGLTHHVEPPQACVCVAGVEGLEAVAQVSLTGHLGQFTGQVLGSERTEINVRTCIKKVQHRSGLVQLGVRNQHL